MHSACILNIQVLNQQTSWGSYLRLASVWGLCIQHCAKCTAYTWEIEWVRELQATRYFALHPTTLKTIKKERASREISLERANQSSLIYDTLRESRLVKAGQKHSKILSIVHKVSRDTGSPLSTVPQKQIRNSKTDSETHPTTYFYFNVSRCGVFFCTGVFKRVYLYIFYGLTCNTGETLSQAFLPTPISHGWSHTPQRCHHL